MSTRRGLPENAIVIQGDEHSHEWYSILITAEFESRYGYYQIDGWELRKLNQERELCWLHVGNGIRVHQDSLKKLLAT